MYSESPKKEKKAARGGHGAGFLTPVPTGPQYVQTDGLHEGGKAHCFHASNPEMFDTSAPVEFRHGRLDAGPVPVLLPELRTFFFLSSTGQADILVGVPVVTALFPHGDGTLVKRGAVLAGSDGEDRAVARF